MLSKINLEKIFSITTQIAAEITGKTRYRPEIEWSNKSWTHNVFRLFELVFGRRYGIRAESTVYTYTDKDNISYTIHQMHSWESVFAYFESMIRGMIPKVIPVKVYLPAFAFGSGLDDFKLAPVGYVFAIAYDTSTTDNGSGTTQTYSHTTTGSDRGLLNASTQQSSGTKVSGVTYNGTSMTLIDEAKYAGGSFWFKGFYLPNPSSGANNVVVTYGGTGGRGSITTSYTGCLQTSGMLDGYLKKEQTNNTTISQTHTVTASNCWGVSMLLGYNLSDGDLGLTGSLASKRGGINDMIFLADSNGTVSTGSVTMGWTDVAPAGLNAMINLSIAPAGGGGGSTFIPKIIQS